MSSPKIVQSFNTDVVKKYEQVENKANTLMKSFADFVDEINKLKELSSGTEAKEQITSITSTINNDSVFMARNLMNQLGGLHEAINPGSVAKDQAA